MRQNRPCNPRWYRACLPCVRGVNQRRRWCSPWCTGSSFPARSSSYLSNARRPREINHHELLFLHRTQTHTHTRTHTKTRGQAHSDRGAPASHSYTRNQVDTNKISSFLVWQWPLPAGSELMSEPSPLANLRFNWRKPANKPSGKLLLLTSRAHGHTQVQSETPRKHKFTSHTHARTHAHTQGRISLCVTQWPDPELCSIGTLWLTLSLPNNAWGKHTIKKRGAGG